LFWTQRSDWVQALPGVIVSWGETKTLLTQVCKIKLAILMLGLGVTLQWTSFPSQIGPKILLASYCYGNQNNFSQDGSLVKFRSLSILRID